VTRGLEGEVRLATPAQLAELLRRGELDAALVSVTEVLQTGRYDLLDGVALASRGPVRSVLLAHRVPLAEIKTVHLDPASLTSVHLLHVLLRERGWRPRMRVLADYAAVPELEAVLLIGDRALEFAARPPAHAIWDLGQAWWELTGLSFVYAGWALRRGIDRHALCERLRRACAQGQAELEGIIAERPEHDAAFRRVYLRECMHFALGAAEKQGLARFGELLEKHGRGPVYPPRYVS
jgi:chorismate dehydratase